MTPTQKAILEKLMDEDMSTTELATELHINACVIKNTLKVMLRRGQIKKDGNYFSIAVNYNPPLEWNFKPLLKAWK